MEADPTRVCELIVGLEDVEVLGVEDGAGEPLRVHPDLQRTDHVIKSPEELEALIAAYRIRPLFSGWCFRSRRGVNDPPSAAALWARLRGPATIGSSAPSPGAVRVVETVGGEVRRRGASVLRGDGLFDQVQQFGLAADAE